LPFKIPWYNHLVALYVSIRFHENRAWAEELFWAKHGETDRHIHDSHCRHSAIWKFRGENALIWHLSTCRSLFTANIKRDRKCNIYSENRTVLEFKDVELRGYRIWILL
jgi:hypothetical protein